MLCIASDYQRDLVCVSEKKLLVIEKEEHGNWDSFQY